MNAINILRPAYIDENGYRYYSLEQYFIFDIIINMRKLGIPLKEIADYIQNRDVNALQLFYKRKQTEYQYRLILCNATLLICRQKSIAWKK